MLKACFLVKYPPIEGGVSMHSYWLARGLAERGNQVHVVTNAAEVEPDYRMYMDREDRDWYEPRFESAGGFVSVRNVEPLGRDMTHIPQSNPFVTKLASVATDVIRRQGCDVIFAYYFEPYGMAAYLASQWTGTPFILRHAGSDLGRLMRQRDLNTAYREILHASSRIWTAMTPEPFLAIGIEKERLWSHAAFRVPGIFSPEAPPLDINALLARLAVSEGTGAGERAPNPRPFDASLPTIGIYGKVGEVKGSFDLIEALASLKEQGLRFNFVAVTQGRALPQFEEAVRERGLEERTWILPFIPHWRIPSFIRACTAVCFLERDFPITFHGPTVPKEVMACGTCLIVSEEIAEKQPARMKHGFRHGQNVLLVNDPRQTEPLAAALALAIRDPQKAAAIGAEGRRLYGEAFPGTESSSGTVLSGLEAFEEVLGKVADEGPLARPHGPVRAVDDAQPHVLAARIKTCLPLTSALLGSRWEELAERYLRGSERRPGAYPEAVAFCDFLLSDDAAASPEVPYLRDVLRYEKAHSLLFVDADEPPPPRTTWARYLRRREAELSPLAKLGGAGSVRGLPLLLGLKPVAARDVDVQRLDHDVRPLRRALRKGAPPEGLPAKPTLILFKAERNFVGLEWEITPAAARLLELCDGTRTVAEILEEMRVFCRSQEAEPSSDEEVTTDALRLVRRLLAVGVIAMPRPLPASAGGRTRAHPGLPQRGRPSPPHDMTTPAME